MDSSCKGPEVPPLAMENLKAPASSTPTLRGTEVLEKQTCLLFDIFLVEWLVGFLWVIVNNG